MLNPFLRLAFCFLIVQTSFSQVLIEGYIFGAKSRKPIPFANIGIWKSGIGTLSNENGSFSLRIPAHLLKDSVRFSSLGFEAQSFSVQSMANSASTIILLTEKAVLLKEVTVREKKMKPQVFSLGNDSMKGGVLEEDTTYAGRSIALLIENKDPKPDQEFPLYLEKASLHVFRNNLESIRFRVRINEVEEKTGLPGKDILERSVIVESTLRSGWLEFDLSSMNIVVSKPFFVTFEQLTTKHDRIAIANGYRKFMLDHPERVKFDTVLINGKKEVRQILKRGGVDLPGTFVGIGTSDNVKNNFSSFVRETSFAEWKKVRGIVTATVTVSTHPAQAKK